MSNQTNNQTDQQTKFEAILALIVAGLFIVGFVLGLIGSITGMVYKPFLEPNECISFSYYMVNAGISCIGLAFAGVFYFQMKGQQGT